VTVVCSHLESLASRPLSSAGATGKGKSVVGSKDAREGSAFRRALERSSVPTKSHGGGSEKDKAARVSFKGKGYDTLCDEICKPFIKVLIKD
jgi:hypothetical protein